MKASNRRTFLGASVGAVALGGTVARTWASGKVPPSERVRIAVMGVRGRGRGLAEGFAALDRAEVATLCDVDASVLPDAVSAVASRQGAEPRSEKDFRRVLDDPSIHALVVATPDHWHAPATIFACQAGKHVYVEKPASHTLWEGQKMVEAARKYKRVVQVGTQSRSAPHYREIVQLLRDGRVGDLYMARAWNSQLRPDLSPAEDTNPPSDVDYDLWLGPAPQRPFNPNRFHYSWHWHWDYGTGDVGNDGVHDLDIARWGLGVGLPTSVSCTAARVNHPNWETPDTVLASFTFPETKAMLVFEQRDWSPYVQEGFENGVAFYGTKGYILVGRQGWRLVEAGNKDVPVPPVRFSDEPHFQNFLDAIQENGTPNADIEEGHQSAALAHLANIAYRVGRSFRFDPKTQTIPDDPEAQALTRRDYRDGFGIPVQV